MMDYVMNVGDAVARSLAGRGSGAGSGDSTVSRGVKRPVGMNSLRVPVIKVRVPDWKPGAIDDNGEWDIVVRRGKARLGSIHRAGYGGWGWSCIEGENLTRGKPSPDLCPGKSGGFFGEANQAAVIEALHDHWFIDHDHEGEVPSPLTVKERKEQRHDL